MMPQPKPNSRKTALFEINPETRVFRQLRNERDKPSGNTGELKALHKEVWWCWVVWYSDIKEAGQQAGSPVLSSHSHVRKRVTFL
ncbi:hypothetical protein GBF38_001988 [Nibea albiflora]|uniref:Uncharacterized protein n=1 Tax=Nibea albiflora TaxID=240163 RepID=A0ACB7ED10_NIBAL|nr:hypothetical protein GBF38_001988 [Nibea albiflora]